MIELNGSNKLLNGKTEPVNGHAGICNDHISISNDLEQLSRNINHELRTPLVAIQLGINAVKDYLPQLIESYAVANRNNLVTSVIHPRHLATLSRTLENVEREAHFAAAYLNMLMLNLKEIKKENLHLNTLSISHCLKKAIREYSCRSRLQKKILQSIHLPVNNFQFRGDEELVVNVIMNLIHHTLYHFQEGDPCEILIEIETTKCANHFIFKYPKQQDVEIIDENYFQQDFFVYTKNIRCGLAFCQEIMHAINGDICFRLNEEQFVEFKLTFPLHI